MRTDSRFHLISQQWTGILIYKLAKEKGSEYNSMLIVSNVLLRKMFCSNSNFYFTLKRRSAFRKRKQTDCSLHYHRWALHMIRIFSFHFFHLLYDYDSWVIVAVVWMIKCVRKKRVDVIISIVMSMLMDEISKTIRWLQLKCNLMPMWCGVSTV